MKFIKNCQWIDGQEYKKRILIDKLDKKIDLIEDVIVRSKGEIPIHEHDSTDEIFYVTDNSAVIIIEEKKYKINPGDMICVDRKEKHGFLNESDKPFKMIVFKLDHVKGDSYLK